MESKTDREILLSVVLITYNEEEKLADCLRSVSFTDEIIIVDSGSTDRTREVAAEFNARFSVRNFDNFASQKNAAIEKASGRWVLLLDADERLSPELQSEIRSVLGDPNASDAYSMKRRNYLFGGRMRFGANLNDWQLRLLRRGQGHFSGLVHERVKSSTPPRRLKGELIHYSSQTLDEYFVKFPLFSSLDAKVMWAKGEKPALFHFLIKPPLSFLYFYVLRLGFLDGFRGLLYQTLATYYLYVKYRKVLGLYREKGKPHNFS